MKKTTITREPQRFLRLLGSKFFSGKHCYLVSSVTATLMDATDSNKDYLVEMIYTKFKEGRFELYPTLLRRPPV